MLSAASSLFLPLSRSFRMAESQQAFLPLLSTPDISGIIFSLEGRRLSRLIPPPLAFFSLSPIAAAAEAGRENFLVFFMVVGGGGGGVRGGR